MRQLRYRLLYLPVIIFLVTELTGLSQEYNYARLTVLYGGNIPFNFLSINDYKNGKRIERGTLLGITLVDSNKVGTTLEGFSLMFRSFNSQPAIEGSASNIPLNAIQVEAVNNIGLPSPNATYFGLQDLDAGGKELLRFIQNPISPPDFANLNWSTHQIYLNYECGKKNVSMFNHSPDYYSVEIEFELIPLGPGF